MASVSSLAQDDPVVASCPLCCEVDELVSLRDCQHQSCRTCLTKWIKKEEVSGQAMAACPFCRNVLSDEGVHSILGRHFQPRETPERDQNFDEIDELTLQWINSQTRLCPGCGYHVEKDDGCDHIECLCGYEFCFGCGRACCNCDSQMGNFENEGYIAIRSGDGQVSIEACMRRTNVHDERDGRQLERQQEEADRWRTYNCPSSGDWIFFRGRNTDSIKYLQWLLSPKTSTMLCDSRRFTLHCEENDRWSWDVPGVSRYTGYGPHLGRQPEELDRCSAKGDWIFARNKNCDSIKYLLWLFAPRGSKELKLSRSRYDKMLILHEEELDRWNVSRDSPCTCDGKWLFSKKSFKILAEQYAYGEIARIKSLATPW